MLILLYLVGVSIFIARIGFLFGGQGIFGIKKLKFREESLGVAFAVMGFAILALVAIMHGAPATVQL